MRKYNTDKQFWYKHNIKSGFNGFTISEMLIVLVIIGIISAATIPMFTLKKKMKDFEISSLNCVRTEYAADLNSPACVAAIKKAQFGQENAINTLAFLVNNGRDANEKEAASKILRTACDNGGNKACEYFITACQKDSTLCDTGGLYDLRHYLELMPETNDHAGDSAKFLMQDKAEALYDSNNTNIKTMVDYTCCPNVNMACVINGCTECTFAKHCGNYGEYKQEVQAMTISGNYVYVTGVEWDYSEIFVIKFNALTGKLLWKKRYGGNMWEEGQGIMVLGNYVYVTGFETADAASGNKDIFVMQLNSSDGTARWTKHYGGTGTGEGRAFATAYNSLYVTGYETTDAPSGWADIIVMRLNPTDGSVVWKKHYGGTSDDMGNSIAVSDNFIYVTGQEKSDPGGNNDIVVMKLNPDGSIVWKKRFGGASSDIGYSIAVSGSFVYVTGEEASDTAGTADVFVIKLNTSDGSPAWTKRFGGANSDVGRSIAVSGGFAYVTGTEASDTAGNFDIFAMKLNTSDGSPVWTKHFGGLDTENSFSLFVTGNYLYVGGNADGTIAVLKLLEPNQTSNMTWTANSMGAGWTANGVDILNAKWGTSGGDAMSYGGNWTANGLAVNPSLWIHDGVELNASWTDCTFIQKNAAGWTIGLKKDGVPD